MAARGIQPAPSTAVTLGMQAAAAAEQLGLPHVPIFPEQPAPDSSTLGPGGQEEEEEAAAAAAQGAAGPSPRDVQAASEARIRGNTCYTKRQYEQARAAGLGRAGDPRLRRRHASLTDGDACHAPGPPNPPHPPTNHSPCPGWPQAAAQYRRATELDPGSKFSWSNLAAALLQLRRWDEAVDACDKVGGAGRGWGGGAQAWERVGRGSGGWCCARCGPPVATRTPHVASTASAFLSTAGRGPGHPFRQGSLPAGAGVCGRPPLDAGPVRDRRERWRGWTAGRRPCQAPTGWCAGRSRAQLRHRRAW